jgi:hypothetical protein
MGAGHRLALSHTVRSCRFRMNAVFGKSSLDLRMSACRHSNCKPARKPCRGSQEVAVLEGVMKEPLHGQLLLCDSTQMLEYRTMHCSCGLQKTLKETCQVPWFQGVLGDCNHP